MLEAKWIIVSIIFAAGVFYATVHIKIRHLEKVVENLIKEIKTLEKMVWTGKVNSSEK